MKVLGKGMKERQAILISISLVFFLPFLGMFLLLQSKTLLVIVLLYILLIGLFNVVYSIVYEIQVDQDFIYIKNLYRKIIIPSSEFQSITKVINFTGSRFIPFPFMSPPYFACHLRNGKRYIYVDMSLKAFFSLLSFDDAYLKKINKEITAIVERRRE